MQHQLIETLEGRTLLAGNVSAVISDGNLIISGDSAANAIRITGNVLDRKSLRVIADDEGTLINGETAPFFVETAIKHVIVRLRGGDDSLALADADIARDLRIDLGAGADRLSTSQLLVRRDLTIHGRDGSDTLLVNDAGVWGRTGIAAEDGKDVVVLSGSSFRQHARVLGGAGNDVISRFASRFIVDPELISGPGADQVDAEGLTFTYDFNNGREGWHSGFADWRRSDRNLHEFVAEPRELPAELDTNRRGYNLSGDNRTDDLLMFLTRSLSAADGLHLGNRFLVAFDIRFASNGTSGGFGVGGSPGDSVFLKAGAATTAPATSLDDGGLYRLNLDHGQQAIGGKDVSLISSIANGIDAGELADPDNPPYRSLRRPHVHPEAVTISPTQTLHLLVGTDSGYEATTSVYYQSITVRLIPLQPTP